MDYDALVLFIQSHFTDGLVIIIGSGLSAAEGISGMGALAAHLSTGASVLTGSDAALWSQIQAVLDKKEGLEAALIRHPPSRTLEDYIVKSTCELLLPEERRVIANAIGGRSVLRLTTFLQKVLKSPTGIPIITTNYDRLVEVACELAGLHVDSMAIGIYGGAFDSVRSCMASCRGIITRAKQSVLDHFPRAIVLKPHGSLDWFRLGSEARRCSIDIDGERLIITPGLNKYRAGYDSPFDRHRELANKCIDSAARLLIVGYGFNDDHLQTHLNSRIASGVPTLIINRTSGPNVISLAQSSPKCISISKPSTSTGISVVTQGTAFERPGFDLWDIGVLTKELLT